MSFEDNSADDRLLFDQCIDEIKSLQSTIAAQAEALVEARNLIGSVMAFLHDDFVITKDHCAKVYANLCTIISEPSHANQQ